MAARARRTAARVLRLAARLVEQPRTTVLALTSRGSAPGDEAAAGHDPGPHDARHVSVPLAGGAPLPRQASGTDADRVDLVVTVDADDLEHRPEVLRALAEAARASGLRTSAVVYEAEEAVGRTHGRPTLPDGLPLVVHHVVRGWSAALASTYPFLEGGRVVVTDSSVAMRPEAMHALAGAVTGDIVLAQAVLRRSDETVATAGALFVGPLSAPAPLLAGFPSEDAERSGTVEVTAADAPAFAARTSAFTVPPATADVPLAVAALSLAARAGGGRVVAVPLGRVHQLREPVRRSDVVAQDLLQGWAGQADPAGRAVLASLGLVLGQGTAAPVPDDGRVPLRVAQPVLLRRPPVVEESAPRLRWSVKTAAWAGERGDDWGDVFFAHDLAGALRDLGQDVVVDNRQSAVRPASEHLDDVSLVLRGLDRVALSPHAVNLLWVISHPDLVGDVELAGQDRAWSAGRSWAERTSARTGTRVETLLQATDPDRFSPGPVDEELRSDVLFVGKTRGVVRPVVRDAVAAGLDVSVWGGGWEGILTGDHLRGTFLPNDRLPAAYRSARIVLNDHWADMAREGFVSNRVFDALASGAVVVSDEVAGLSEALGSAVHIYRDVDDLRRLGAELRDVDEVQRRDTARRIAREHSFARRAEVLLDAAVPLVRTRSERAPGA